MSGDIDEISEKLGKLQNGVEVLLAGQQEQAKDMKSINKSLVTAQMQQSAIERRFSKHENEFKKFVSGEFAELKVEVESRLKPLEGLSTNIKWFWGVVCAAVTISFSAFMSKVTGWFG